MKMWSAIGVLIVTLLLSSCGSLVAPGGDYQWYAIGPKLRDFGGFRLAQDGTPLYFSFNGGNLRYSAALNLWEGVETPGGYAAVYEVARDGTEFVTSYGIYTRPASTAAWTLIPGSRALGLQYLALDRDGSLYGVVDSFSTLLPAGSSRVYVKLKGGSTWTAVSGLPSSDLVARVGIDPIGRAYILTTTTGSTTTLGFQLQGSSAVSMIQPEAQTYDLAGNRYFYSNTFPPVFQRITPSGATELWKNFAGVKFPAISAYLGFGKDGRLYAVSGFNSTLGFDFSQGDVIAISPGDSKWSLVASGLQTESYRSVFAPDGSLYFFGCESGCNGSGNAFSYGVYRLNFGGNP